MKLLFPQKSQFPAFLSLFFSFLFLIYLACTTQILIIHDAIGYQKYGKMIYEGGIKAYASDILRPEPYFPVLVAFSMHLADLFNCHFHTTLLFLNILSLILTLFILLYIFKDLKFPNILSAILLLYTVLSPTTLNITFSIFSESGALPLILLIVFLYKKILDGIFHLKPHLALYSILFSLILIITILAESIFEIIFPILLLIPCLLFLNISKEKKKTVLKPLLAFLLTAGLITSSGIYGYKAFNKKMNDTFAITNRGSFALYGNTARRVLPRTPKQLLSAFVNAPDLDLCGYFFSLEDCSFWDFEISNTLGQAKKKALQAQGFTQDEVNSKLNWLSLKEISKNPIQFGYLYFVEIFRMFSWGGTNIGSLVWPRWLQGIYQSHFFAITNGIWTLLLSLASFIACFCFLFKNRKRLTEDNGYLWLIAVLTILTPYIFLHGFFLVQKRYIIPVVALYMILIGFTVLRAYEKILLRKTKKS